MQVRTFECFGYQTETVDDSEETTRNVRGYLEANAAQKKAPGLASKGLYEDE